MTLGGEMPGENSEPSSQEEYPIRVQLAKSLAPPSVVKINTTHAVLSWRATLGPFSFRSEVEVDAPDNNEWENLEEDTKRAAAGLDLGPEKSTIESRAEVLEIDHVELQTCCGCQQCVSGEGGGRVTADGEPAVACPCPCSRGRRGLGCWRPVYQGSRRRYEVRLKRGNALHFFRLLVRARHPPPERRGYRRPKQQHWPDSSTRSRETGTLPSPGEGFHFDAVFPAKSSPCRRRRRPRNAQATGSVAATAAAAAADSPNPDPDKAYFPEYRPHSPYARDVSEEVCSVVASSRGRAGTEPPHGNNADTASRDKAAQWFASDPVFVESPPAAALHGIGTALVLTWPPLQIFSGLERVAYIVEQWSHEDSETEPSLLKCPTAVATNGHVHGNGNRNGSWTKGWNRLGNGNGSRNWNETGNGNGKRGDNRNGNRNGNWNGRRSEHGTQAGPLGRRRRRPHSRHHDLTPPKKTDSKEVFSVGTRCWFIPPSLQPGCRYWYRLRLVHVGGKSIGGPWVSHATSLPTPRCVDAGARALVLSLPRTIDERHGAIDVEQGNSDDEGEKALSDLQSRLVHSPSRPAREGGARQLNDRDTKTLVDIDERFSVRDGKEEEEEETGLQTRGRSEPPVVWYTLEGLETESRWVVLYRGPDPDVIVKGLQANTLATFRVGINVDMTELRRQSLGQLASLELEAPSPSPPIYSSPTTTTTASGDDVATITTTNTPNNTTLCRSGSPPANSVRPAVRLKTAATPIPFMAAPASSHERETTWVPATSPALSQMKREGFAVHDVATTAAPMVEGGFHPSQGLRLSSSLGSGQRSQDNGDGGEEMRRSDANAGGGRAGSGKQGCCSDYSERVVFATAPRAPRFAAFVSDGVPQMKLWWEAPRHPDSPHHTGYLVATTAAKTVNTAKTTNATTTAVSATATATATAAAPTSAPTTGAPTTAAPTTAAPTTAAPTTAAPTTAAPTTAAPITAPTTAPTSGVATSAAPAAPITATIPTTPAPATATATAAVAADSEMAHRNGAKYITPTENAPSPVEGHHDAAPRPHQYNEDDTSTPLLYSEPPSFVLAVFDPVKGVMRPVRSGPELWADLNTSSARSSLRAAATAYPVRLSARIASGQPETSVDGIIVTAPLAPALERLGGGEGAEESGAVSLRASWGTGMATDFLPLGENLSVALEMAHAWESGPPTRGVGAALPPTVRVSSGRVAVATPRVPEEPAREALAAGEGHAGEAPEEDVTKTAAASKGSAASSSSNHSPGARDVSVRTDAGGGRCWTLGSSSWTRLGCRMDDFRAVWRGSQGETEALTPRLPPGMRFAFRVRVECRFGVAVSAATVYQTATMVPLPPTGLRACLATHESSTGTTNRCVRLSWDPPDPGHRRSVVTSFSVQARRSRPLPRDGGASLASPGAGAVDPSWQDVCSSQETGCLDPSTLGATQQLAVHYRVRAEGPGGTGPWCEPLQTDLLSLVAAAGGGDSSTDGLADGGPIDGIDLTPEGGRSGRPMSAFRPGTKERESLTRDVRRPRTARRPLKMSPSSPVPAAAAAAATAAAVPGSAATAATAATVAAADYLHRRAGGSKQLLWGALGSPRVARGRRAAAATALGLGAVWAPAPCVHSGVEGGGVDAAAPAAATVSGIPGEGKTREVDGKLGRSRSRVEGIGGVPRDAGIPHKLAKDVSRLLGGGGPLGNDVTGRWGSGEEGVEESAGAGVGLDIDGLLRRNPGCPVATWPSSPLRPHNSNIDVRVSPKWRALRHQRCRRRRRQETGPKRPAG